MIEIFLIKKYISHLEKILTDKDKKKAKYAWNKIKNNVRILKYVKTIENDVFKSNIIIAEILKDKDFFNTLIYKEIVNEIIKNKKLYETKTNNSSSKTFLLLILENENLTLTKEQKNTLISLAKNSKYTETYIREMSSTNFYGAGIIDIKYKLLNNCSFSLQEKKELFDLLYSDDEIRLSILNELEWKIISKLNLKINTENNSEIYELDFNELDPKVIDEINLCKYIKTTIPEEVIKRYMNVL